MDLETVMVNLYYKNNKMTYKKRRTLYSLGIGFVFFVFLYLLTKYVNMPLCLFKRVFDISCPGCGLSRGFIAILNLNFREAIECHVLSIPLFVCICVYVCFSLIDVLGDRNYVEKIEHYLAKPHMCFIYIVIMVVSYIYNHFL